MQALVVWFEIPVFNFERAVEFYSNVFRNIKLELTEFSGIRHAIFKSGVGSPLQMSGALIEYKEKPKEHVGPVLYFDANLGMSHIMENIKTYGGEILLEKTLIRNYRQDGTIIIPKTLIDNQHGYYAYFLDSEGNKMGLYSNS
jgi:uncharacterized protein